MRSQSLPPEFNSLSIRSAKFGHGTNSNFICVPDAAVNSFESSTSAFAGSQAAQQSVRSSALAVVEMAVDASSAAARPKVALDVDFILSSRCEAASHSCFQESDLLQVPDIPEMRDVEYFV